MNNCEQFKCSNKFNEPDKYENGKLINESFSDQSINSQLINQESGSTFHAIYYPIESSPNTIYYQIENGSQNDSIHQNSPDHSYQVSSNDSVTEFSKIYATVENYSYQQYSSVYSIEQSSQNYSIDQTYSDIYANQLIDTDQENNLNLQNVNLQNMNHQNLNHQANLKYQNNLNHQNNLNQPNSQIHHIDTQLDDIQYQNYYLVELQSVPFSYSIQSNNAQIMNDRNVKNANQESNQHFAVQNSIPFYALPNNSMANQCQSPVDYDVNYYDPRNYDMNTNDQYYLDSYSNKDYVDNLNYAYNSNMNYSDHTYEDSMHQMIDLDEYKENTLQNMQSASNQNVVPSINSAKKQSTKSSKNKKSLGENIFPFKLYSILNECQTEAIKWLDDGDAFSIDFDLFEKQYLTKKIFRSNKIKSFVRSLNLYGFSKFKKNQNIYYHPKFRRGDRESLKQILRRNQ